MAPIKRRVSEDHAPSKRNAQPAAEPAAKRIRTSTTERKEQSKPAAAVPDFPTQKPSISSVLHSEGKSFPRGGGSVLTPLEHKQIQIEATKDVLFEHTGSKKAAAANDENEGDPQDGVQKGPKQARRKSSKKSKGVEPKANEEPKVKIESLSFKKLVPGSLVLGQVAQITRRDLVLALPNNLNGYVPLTAISGPLMSRVQKLLGEDDAESDKEEESDEEEDIDLHKLFHIGQYLRACVTSTGSEDNGNSNSKKRIELSIDPREANRGLSQSELVVNSTIQASVVSNEDHGLDMDLGFGDKKLRAFIPSSEVPNDMKFADIQAGAVFLCLITGWNSDGHIVKLTANHSKIGNIKKTHFLTNAPTIDVFLPGTAVEILITETASQGLCGKIMGMLDVTADIIHSGAAQSQADLTTRYKIGTKLKARVICTFPNSDPRRVGVSLLHHITNLTAPSDKTAKPSSDLPQPLGISSFVDSAKVLNVEPTMGLFLDVGVPGISGYAHISRISDRRIDALEEKSGPYAVGTSHRARVIGYNALDGLHIISLEDRVLDQPFLRLEDVHVGEVVKGTVEKLLITATGGVSLIVKIAEGITGLVPETHLADAQLKNPEKKFKEGAKVTARVLSVNLDRRQFRLTLKKSLVNSEAPVWSDYGTISVGDQSPGTIVNVIPNGAVVEFYGRIRAFLPKEEMSEAFIDDPAKHFNIGQVVNVRILDVNAATGNMRVSCKDPNAMDPKQKKSFKSLEIGQLVNGVVLEKSNDALAIELEQGIKGILKLGLLTDGSEKKEDSAFKRIRVGQKLEDILVLRKFEKRLQVDVTLKPSLVAAAKAGTLVKKFEDVREDQQVEGFVRNIESSRVFVEFGGGIVGALFISQMNEKMRAMAKFGLHIHKSISAKVSHIDFNENRFRLATNFGQAEAQDPENATETGSQMPEIGKKTQATITTVLDTQLLVKVKEGVFGRIDISEVFDEWDDIPDKKRPLAEFKVDQVLDVTVVGNYHVRNYRFLPLSHRKSGNNILELTARKRRSGKDVLKLDNLKPGSQHIAFINRVADGYVWLNLSPSVRGRMDLVGLLDVSLDKIHEQYRVGSAIHVQVKSVDTGKGRLDLTATSAHSAPLTWETISDSLLLLGRILSITDKYVHVQLSDDVAGIIPLTELADDYDNAKPADLERHAMVRVKVVGLDKPNKKVTLSTRPSNILDSRIKSKDRQILQNSDLKVNDVVRGFVKNVADKGLYVTLGSFVTGFVKVSDLSDSYIKDWKAAFQVDQIVKSKVLDTNSPTVLLTLKSSILDKDYSPPITFEDLKQGSVVTGTIRKAVDFGVFIVVDNSHNVSGLCHKSQIADEPVESVEALYSEGDKVKAFVIKINAQKRQVSFGMKASYFEDLDEDDGDVDMSDGGAELSEIDEHEDDEALDARKLEALDVASDNSDVEEDGDVEDMDVDEDETGTQTKGLDLSGFDWNVQDMVVDNEDLSYEEADDTTEAKKKRKRKAAIIEDKTDSLDKNGPQSVADFERLLLGSPDESLLWIQYMAFQASLNEIEKAREIARRALRTISIKDQDSKLDVRTAWLNLETQFGSDDTVDEVFQDARTCHGDTDAYNRLVDIYIKMNKLEKADSLFQSMMKVKEITKTPEFWVSYATFLLTTLNTPDRARALLQRARQSVEQELHRELTTRFCTLEFKSPNGEAERGRTAFEQLLQIYPKRQDLWDVYVDMEKKHGEESNVRSLYERMSKTQMKNSRAKTVFRMWREWEKKMGNQKGVDRVNALEEERTKKRNEAEE